MARRRIDLNELARRVRRQGLLRTLAEEPPRAAPPRPVTPPAPVQPPPAADVPPPAPEPPAEPEPVVDPAVTERLQACRLPCSAAVIALADLPAIESGGRVIEVALLRLRVHRPEGYVECCVRQQVPPEIRSVMAPGARVIVLAHEHARDVAVVDWRATGDRIGARLTFPSAPEQYDWPARADWPAAGEIEVRDANGRRETLQRRRGEWTLTSAGLVSLTPLRSRVDQRDEWRIALQLPGGRTVAVDERVPLLALARLRSDDGAKVGVPLDVLVSAEGEVAVDWEATLRQPELRTRR